MQTISLLGVKLGQDRRRYSRASLALRLRLRGADFSDGDLAEIADTLNASRQGFYFQTPSHRYYKGMRLRVTLPYDAVHCATHWDEFGEVIRIDGKSGPANGVAIRRATLLNSRAVAPAEACIDRVDRMESAAAMLERRLEQRFPFVASVGMTDTQTGTTIRARTSDLSASGCYIDTLNPLPVGAILDLWIEKKDESLQARASVRAQHIGSGMGVAFTDLVNEHHSIVRNWIFEANPNSDYLRVTENGTPI